MRYGFTIPSRGPLANRSDIGKIARKGEELGFDILSVSDHIIVPKSIESIYPYSESGAFVGGESGECMEQLAELSFLSAITSKVRLLTSVMVLPHRNPVLTAKILATIDVLSEGRLIVGCGVGWMQEEFSAIGTAPYGERGAVSDEYIRVFKELWTKENPRFQGKYANFSDVTFAPKPIQKPHPPIWIGGESPPALRRAAELGDAWYPIGSNPRFPVGTPTEFSSCLSRVRENANKIGRDPDSIDLAYSASWYNEEKELLSDGERRCFTGNPSEISDDIKVFEELGVRTLMLRFGETELDNTLSRMEHFALNIKSLVD